MPGRTLTEPHHSAGPVDAGDPAGLTDEGLLVAIGARRDRAAFAELFRRWSGRLRLFLVRSGMAGEKAEEIAQEVMVTLWRRAGTFDPARAGAATWIFTIARNRRIDALRRARRPEPDPTDPMFAPEPEPSSETTAAVTERDAKVREAVAGLGPEQVAVVSLAFFAGLSHAEIAARVDAPLGTVKSRLRLAFARLREALGADFSEELRND